MCFFPMLLFFINGKLALKASSCTAHADFTPTKLFDISAASNFVYASNDCKLYEKSVATTVASKSLLNPDAISSLSPSASSLFCAKRLSLFIFPLSAATILSVSN